ncbi:MAG TPA: HAD family phosphatase [Thermomicrobiales bacterium]|nr:HAD family phosphatase [Thermomicrobiales bacterium]
MATPQRPPLAAVVFDMDGLLVDTETISHRAWEQYLARDHGATLTEADYAAIVGTYSLDTWTIIRDRLGLPLNLPDDLARLEAAVDAVYRGLLAEGVAPLPGAVDLARACHAAGLRLGIASSSPLARVAEIVASVGLADIFDALTSGDEVPYSKPDPAIYRLACERLGVPPAAAVAVEDSGPGILAARAAGLRSLAVPSIYTSSHDLSAASAVVPSLVGVTPADLAALPW